MLEDAAYRRLLDWYYQTEQPLPADQRAIYRRVRAASEAEREAVDVVLAEFFTLDDGVYRHGRCEEEIARVRSKSEKARSSALLGVAARRNDSDSRQIRSERMAQARAQATHTKEEWTAMLLACGGACVRCGEQTAELQKDHIQPVYQGGSDGIENLQPLCKTCNTSKGPEAIDHRRPGWRSAFADVLAANAVEDGSERLAPNSHKPIANSHKPKVERENARGARIPPDFPDESAKRWAVEQRPLLDVDAVAEGFRDYWLAKPGRDGTKADWPATWRMWVRRQEIPRSQGPPRLSVHAQTAAGFGTQRTTFDVPAKLVTSRMD